MVGETNGEIIRQLYFAVTSVKQKFINRSVGGSGFTQYTSSARPSCLKTFRNFFNAVGFAFPDYELNIEKIVEKGDRVMVRYSISGTHQGIFMGLLPTNERLTITGIDVFRLDQGKVVQHWDAAHQVSALPAKTVLPFGSGNVSRKEVIPSRPMSEQLSLSA